MSFVFYAKYIYMFGAPTFPYVFSCYRYQMDADLIIIDNKWKGNAIGLS